MPWLPCCQQGSLIACNKWWSVFLPDVVVGASLPLPLLWVPPCMGSVLFLLSEWLSMWLVLCLWQCWECREWLLSSQPSLFSRTSLSRSICREWYSQHLRPPQFRDQLWQGVVPPMELSHTVEWPSFYLLVCVDAHELSFAMVRWIFGVLWCLALRAGSSGVTCGGWPTTSWPSLHAAHHRVLVFGFLNSLMLRPLLWRTVTLSIRNIEMWSSRGLNLAYIRVHREQLKSCEWQGTSSTSLICQTWWRRTRERCRAWTYIT